MNELREMIIQERDDRKDEAKTMDDFFRSENDQRKKNLDDVNEWIRVENEKRLDIGCDLSYAIFLTCFLL